MTIPQPEANLDGHSRSGLLVGAFSELAAHAVPERLQVRIINPRPFNRVLVNGYGLLEAVLAFVYYANTWA